MKDTNLTATLTLKTDQTFFAKIKELAEQENKTMSEIVRMLLVKGYVKYKNEPTSKPENSERVKDILYIQVVKEIISKLKTTIKE